MRRRNAVLGVLGLVAVVAATVVYFRYRSVAVQPEPLDLSREVVRTDRPVDALGRIDLTTAIPSGEAPPTEQNAVVALLPLLGTSALIGDREEVLRRLGAPTGLPEKVPLAAAPDMGHEGLAELEPAARERVQRWVDGLESSLQAFVEATRRPRLWTPVVWGGEGYEALTPALPLFRLGDLFRALETRAELRMLHGDWKGGWGDVQAMLRLHDIATAPAGFIDGLVRSGFLDAAFRTLLRALRYGSPPPDLAREITEALTGRTPPQSLTGELEFERMNVVAHYLHGVQKPGEDVKAPTKDFAHANRAVQAIHASFDAVAPWMATTSRENADRLAAYAKQDRKRTEQLAEDGESFGGKVALLLRTWWHGDDFIGRTAGELVGSMVVVVTPIRMQRVLRDEQHRRMALLALALRAHRRAHGSFPASLDVLGPDALAPLAADPLGVGPIPYRLQDSGCVLGTEATDEFELRD